MSDSLSSLEQPHLSSANAMDYLNPYLLPGYRESVERESKERENAFLKIPESIGAIEVKPLTPRHLQILRVVKSPYIVSQAQFSTLIDVGIFLWVVSPGWKPLDTIFARLQRWSFMRRLDKSFRKIGTPKDALKKYSEEITAYIRGSFADAPGTSNNSTRSYWSFTASLVDRFGEAYGWTQEVTENYSFKTLFQLIAIQRRRHDPEAKFFNPSDKIISDFLAGLQKEEDLKRAAKDINKVPVLHP